MRKRVSKVKNENIKKDCDLKHPECYGMKNSSLLFTFKCRKMEEIVKWNRGTI